MGVFRFKRFSVANEASAQKVGTDAVLLGAAAPLPPAGPSGWTSPGSGQQPSVPLSVLDVGTGTGVVALMLAQRFSDAGKEFRIIGIDSDAPSASEAASNFAASEWAGSMEARHMSFSQCDDAGTWDLIVSNPPYYDLSLEAPDPRRSAARHTDTLSFRELCAYASGRLSAGGFLSMILPADQEKALMRYAASFSLYPFSILRIRTTERKPPSRIVVSLSRKARTAVEESSLVLMEKGKRTAEYASLACGFYL